MADLTPQEALEQFERTTGFRIHAATDADGVVWWRQPSEQPMFECTIGDRCMHIDELAAPKPYGPGNPQCSAQDSAGLDCAGPVGHHGDDHANINGPFTTTAKSESETCLGRNMDCGRRLPCPDHPDRYAPGRIVGNLADDQRDAANAAYDDEPWTIPVDHGFVGKGLKCSQCTRTRLLHPATAPYTGGAQ